MQGRRGGLRRTLEPPHAVCDSADARRELRNGRRCHLDRAGQLVHVIGHFADRGVHFEHGAGRFPRRFLEP